jgi:uncharacterized protein
MMISIKTIPNSKKVEITKLDEKNYRIKLDAPPKEGRANLRLVEILSEYFNVPKSMVHIVRGEKSKEKIIKID